MFSTKIDKCNSPRPETFQASGESVGSTRKLTSVPALSSGALRFAAMSDISLLVPQTDCCSHEKSSAMSVHQSYAVATARDGLPDKLFRRHLCHPARTTLQHPRHVPLGFQLASNR